VSVATSEAERRALL